MYNFSHGISFLYVNTYIDKILFLSLSTCPQILIRVHLYLYINKHMHMHIDKIIFISLYK